MVIVTQENGGRACASLMLLWKIAMQPFVEPALGELDRPSRLTGKQQFIVLRPLLAVCMLLWVALYNGYPTIFSDTGSYLYAGAFFVEFPPFRSPGYSLFTKLTSLGISGWFTIAMQAVVMVYVLDKACGYLLGGKRKFCDNYVLAAVGTLAIFTSLPWVVSLLMPDFFAGIVFLSAFLLAFDGQSGVLERICLAVILMISVSAHASLLPIAGMYVGALLLRRLAGRTLKGIPSTASMLGWLLVPIIAAGFCTATLNHKMGLGFRLSPSKNVFLLARLFDDGLAADFLHENCPNQQFVACRYVACLPRSGDEFLYKHPLLHDMAGHEDEMGSIVRRALSAYSGRFITSSIKRTVLQLGTIRTGDEIRSYGERPWNAAVVHQVFPVDFASFLDSRQSRGQLLTLANTFATIHTTIFWLSVVTCLALGWTSGIARMNQFLCFAIVFLIINAAVCATLSGVFDRYQSRVAWIIPLCLTVQIACLARERKLTLRQGERLERETFGSPGLDSN
jgi:hypothetical protein